LHMQGPVPWAQPSPDSIKASPQQIESFLPLHRTEVDWHLVKGEIKLCPD